RNASHIRLGGIPPAARASPLEPAFPPPDCVPDLSFGARGLVAPSGSPCVPIKLLRHLDARRTSLPQCLAAPSLKPEARACSHVAQVNACGDRAKQMPRSGHEQHLSCSLTPFEGTMSVCCIRQRKSLPDPHSHLAVPDPAEKLASPPIQLLPGCGVVAERGPCEKQRSLSIEKLWIKRIHSSAGLPEQHHGPAWGEHIQPLEKCASSHRIKHNVHP